MLTTTAPRFPADRRTGPRNDGFRPAAMLRQVAEALARRREERRARRHLAALDDAMLHDIGLTRSDIERAVRQGRD